MALTRQPARAAAALALLFVLLAMSPGAAPSAHDADAPTRVVYVLTGEEHGHTTVLIRENVTHAIAPVRIAVPQRAAHHDVHDQDGSALPWSETRSGVLTVGTTPATRTLHIASRNLDGPTPGFPLTFGADGRDPPTLVVVTLNAERNERVEGLRETHTAILATHPAWPEAWPLPDGWRFHWNAEEGLQMPTAIATTAVRPEGILAPYAVATVIGTLLAVLTVWLILRIHRSADAPTRKREMPILGHLEELRRRITTVLLTLAVAALFYFSFGLRWTAINGIPVPYPWPSLYSNAAAQVFAWLSAHIAPPGVDIVVVTPWDAVATLLLLSVAMALITTFPVLFYHAYAFLAPGLYPHERRLVLALSPLVMLLLAIGATFGISLMAPLIVNVLYGFAGAAGAIALVTMSQLVGIAALMGIIFALAFQLPLIMMATARMGIIRAATYRRKWRIAIIVILIVSALVTDPTVITQMIVASVLLALYGLGIVLAGIVDRARGPVPKPTPRD